MNRIDKKFKDLKKKNKTAFISYITAGDPSIEKTKDLVYALERAGSDIVEIGIPFSDPLADGPTIQDAAIRAFNGGVSLEKIFSMVCQIRKNTQIPLVFLVYFNTIYYFGVRKFVEKCASIGVDGLIIPDLPLEEREEIFDYTKQLSVHYIPLVAPTSKSRIKQIVKDCKGFVYCVSSMGVTGARKDFREDIKNYLSTVKEQSHLPIAVGFGISDSETVKQFRELADGVIVGSAIVKMVKKTKGNSMEIEKYVKKLIG